MKKRILAGLLAAVLVLSLVPTAFAAGPAALTYETLEQQMRENNPNFLALEQTIASIEVLDYDKMQEDMRDGLNFLGKSQWTLTTYGQGDSYAHAALSESYSAMRDAFEDLKDGELQKDNAGIIRQLRDAQNQMLMAAETLYVALLDMGNTRTDLQRQLAAMDRTVAEMELRHQRGQISDLQLAQVKNGRAQLESGLNTLEHNIYAYTVQLQALAGMELTGTLKLTEVPEITEQQVAAMNLQKDLESAKAKSYTLYAAGETLADAKDDYLETAREYGFNEARYQFISAQHTYQAARHTYDAAFQSFDLSFLTAYSAVADYRQVLTASETALDVAKKTYAAEELKYKQGSLSKNGLLNAQDTLAAAETAVVAARHDLFSAYLTYQWAVEEGILN